MQELLYLEIPTPDMAAVRQWLQQCYQPPAGEKRLTRDGFCLSFVAGGAAGELSVFLWSVQRTTYLKVFRWSISVLPQEKRVLKHLQQALRQQFPHEYPAPPLVDLTQQSIFAALAPYYPETAKFFQRIPNGEYDLKRVYWWEQRWRESVKNPQQPKMVVFETSTNQATGLDGSLYDLIYLGGALGVIHAAVMARLGYRVLLVERLPFGRMNREWNISRDEFQQLIHLGLFTAAEFEAIIAREYVDGFHKFFDGNNPPQAVAPVLHTPTVLNISLDAEHLLRLCGEKLRAAGGEIWDETEFQRIDIDRDRATVSCTSLVDGHPRSAQGRLVIDAMGTASPIAWQLNGGRAFDSVCPTVGAAIAGGFPAGVWDNQYGDVLNSHGDVSRGRQLIWELFPGRGDEVTIYLFHYHQIHPDNPGSLLEMYEDFFTILPEYRRCDMDALVWRKATFGYIPGHFSVNQQDRRVAFDRLLAIGDAAALQSPLVFTGFGSLVRNLGRLTDLLDTALKANLLDRHSLNQIRAYQSNVAVTWLFSKGMMVPTHRFLPPQRINATLNTFFGVLTTEPAEVTDRFIKDRVSWLAFNRMAIKAAWQNPTLLVWIWQMAGGADFFRWLQSYFDFSRYSLMRWLMRGWFSALLRTLRPWIEDRSAALWLWLLAQNYVFGDQPLADRSPPTLATPLRLPETQPSAQN